MPLPRRLEKSIASNAMPRRSTSERSMPARVPSQDTVQPRLRRVSATARPGITWPPVPAATTTRWLTPGLRA